MDPRMQFVRTRDGVNIAYWELGEGPVLIAITLPSSHAQREWQMPGWRAIYEYTAQAWRFVRYDPRGLGLSDRDVEDFSLDALVRDLEAVVDRLGVPSIRLSAFNMGVTVALAFAARHPERVSHLVAVNGFDRGAEATSPRLGALTDLARVDWEFASEGLTRAFTGWEGDEAARAAAALFRESIHPRQMVALAEQLFAWDVSAELPRITARTLVIQHRGNPAVGPQVARRLAATIPRCEVVMLDGPIDPVLPPHVVTTMGQFLTDASHEPSVLPPRPEVRHRTAVILFADVVGSTALTEQLGDSGFRERARALDTMLRQIITAGEGEPVEGKLLGDGVLAVFAAARDAVAVAVRCAAAGDAAGLRLHVGLHAGDVIREAGNVYGGAVNVAARISGEAAPGEVLASEVVRALARTSTGAAFDDRGEHHLRGVGEVHRLYRVGPGGS